MIQPIKKTQQSLNRICWKFFLPGSSAMTRAGLSIPSFGLKVKLMANKIKIKRATAYFLRYNRNNEYLNKLATRAGWVRHQPTPMTLSSEECSSIINLPGWNLITFFREFKQGDSTLTFHSVKFAMAF